MNINNLSYSSFSGYYGCGDTHSDISYLNHKLMKKYFLKYLNIHKDEIMIGVANLMINEVIDNKEYAFKELEETKNDLINIFKDIE